ncbi:MAG: hypothetical protein GY906_01435 [bacterium]|nr:hypothetical protein [bacterium]
MRTNHNSLLISTMVMVTFAVATAAVAGDEKAAQAALERLNQRWEGAVCELSTPIEIKKGKNKDGWSKSPWIVPPGSREKEEKNCFRAWVSGRSEIAHLLDGKAIRPGTRLISSGWEFEDFDNAEGLQLNLSFEDAPVQMQLRFTAQGKMSTDSFMSAERIRHVEHYMRFVACQVSSKDEQLEVVSMPSTASDNQQAQGPFPVAARPTARIVAVAVQPPKVSPGDEVLLIANYEIDGLPPGTHFEVTETRKLVQDAVILTEFEDRFQRSSGTYSSQLPVAVPNDLAHGIYALHVSITVGGMTREGTAIFQVTAGLSGHQP